MRRNGWRHLRGSVTGKYVDRPSGHIESDIRDRDSRAKFRSDIEGSRVLFAASEIL
jgi:hypothetical protein